MKIAKLVFSPTGGCEKVADILANAMGDEIVSIDLTKPDFCAADVQLDCDICVIAVPVIGGRAISTAIDRVSAIDGKGIKCVLVAVYGNRDFEDALVEMQDAAKNAGFVSVAGISAIAEHSILRKFAAGRPDAKDEAELVSFAKEILKAVESGEPALTLPGNRPYKEFKGSAVKPVAGDGCVKCGICVRNCPVGAISAEKPNETDLEKCVSCMRISLTRLRRHILRRSRRKNRRCFWKFSRDCTII